MVSAAIGLPDWNWDALESIASMLGVIGVIVSIGFLVYEVRHNAKAIEGATIQSLMALEREVFTALADKSDLYVRGGTAYADLSHEDRFGFERLVGIQMSLIYSAYVQFQQGLIDEDVWQAYVNAGNRYFEMAGVGAAWDAISPGYPVPFVAEMAQRQKALSDSAAPTE